MRIVQLAMKSTALENGESRAIAANEIAALNDESRKIFSCDQSVGQMDEQLSGLLLRSTATNNFSSVERQDVMQ